MKFKILYEDNHLLIVVKPVNMAVQADDSRDPDLLTLLKQDLKERYQKPGNVYLGLVHRLDRPVGGVMVFAKTSKAASRLSDQVRTRGHHLARVTQRSRDVRVASPVREGIGGDVEDAHDRRAPGRQG